MPKRPTQKQKEQQRLEFNYKVLHQYVKDIATVTCFMVAMQGHRPAGCRCIPCRARDRLREVSEK